MFELLTALLIALGTANPNLTVPRIGDSPTRAESPPAPDQSPTSSLRDSVTPSLSSPLSGPEIRGKASRPTIVTHDFAGHVTRPDGAPEQAAVELLTLDPATKARIQQILDRRTAAIDAIISNNLDLLIRLQSAGAAPKLEQLNLAAEVYAKLEPLRDLGRDASSPTQPASTTTGSLRRTIRAALPAAPAAEFDRLLNEYWDAIVAEARLSPAPTPGEPAAKSQQPNRFQIIASERLQSLGREFALSFQRLLKSGDLIYAYVSTGLDLTSTQQQKIRELITTFAEQHGENSTKAQQAALVLQVMSQLTPKQRVEVVKRFKKLS